MEMLTIKQFHNLMSKIIKSYTNLLYKLFSKVEFKQFGLA